MDKNAQSFCHTINLEMCNMVRNYFHPYSNPSRKHRVAVHLKIFLKDE